MIPEDPTTSEERVRELEEQLEKSEETCGWNDCPICGSGKVGKIIA